MVGSKRQKRNTKIHNARNDEILRSPETLLPRLGSRRCVARIAELWRGDDQLVNAPTNQGRMDSLSATTRHVPRPPPTSARCDMSKSPARILWQIYATLFIALLGMCSWSAQCNWILLIPSRPNAALALHSLDTTPDHTTPRSGRFSFPGDVAERLGVCASTFPVNRLCWARHMLKCKKKNH